MNSSCLYPVFKFSKSVMGAQGFFDAANKDRLTARHPASVTTLHDPGIILSLWQAKGLLKIEKKINKKNHTQLRHGHSKHEQIL